VNRSAWTFGYDFIAITNHSTSWKLSDQLAPLARALGGTSAAPDLLALNGVESYAGPNDQTHFNAFNRLVILDTDSLTVWHNAIIALYAEDPVHSTHVQLNHPNPEPWFRLPSELDPLPRRIVRNAVELAEYNDRHTYFELLRRGFRVAPVSNTDTHATFQPWEGTGVLPEPGIPPEKWKGEQTGPRTGIVLPANEPFTYEGLLRALRERRAFHTSVASASGFFVVNQHPMGSEFTLAPEERRLDFTLWASTRQGREGVEGWRRVEVWSPFQPDQPLRVIELGESGPVELKQTLSLTPYEGIYVVRLERERPEAEVILAPVWITNPLARPQVSLARRGLTAEDPPCLVIQGGGETLRLQRADAEDAEGTPRDWRTVATLSPGPECHPLERSEGATHWRVVDAFQEQVVSNTVSLPPGPASR
jgi:hypothetical protein